MSGALRDLLAADREAGVFLLQVGEESLVGRRVPCALFATGGEARDDEVVPYLGAGARRGRRVQKDGDDHSLSMEVSWKRVG